MLPVGMTNASVTNNFRRSTRTTTKTMVSTTSRAGSRGWCGFLSLFFCFSFASSVLSSVPDM